MASRTHGPDFEVEGIFRLRLPNILEPLSAVLPVYIVQGTRGLSHERIAEQDRAP